MKKFYEDAGVVFGFLMLILGLATMFFDATRAAWPFLVGFGVGVAGARLRHYA